uniref:Uncharacterized protein n=1 Tax=Brassica oleracea TaxID=3712 RepID=A0A3P6GUP1_BRAOL|nr:unnamed protein product [Brassica oleracea]
MCFHDNYLIPPEPYSFSLRLCPITAWDFGLVHLQGSTSLLESLLGYKLNAIQLDLKSLRALQPTNLAPTSTRFIITSTVANPPSLFSWPQHHQPSPSSTPFSAVASTVPDHSSAAVISTPDYMLGLRNTVFLNQPPSQITQPSPSLVNFTGRTLTTSRRGTVMLKIKYAKIVGTEQRKSVCSKGVGLAAKAEDTTVPLT